MDFDIEFGAKFVSLLSKYVQRYHKKYFSLIYALHKFRVLRIKKNSRKYEKKIQLTLQCLNKLNISTKLCDH